ncbi:hypothetical protein DGMP_39550 [Desulfomarina profundi]|uniref:Amino acid transport protein n=1 Tax=Desulfomarina profundi TaxID=2772557 RepID=A0A8D5JP16_9BACT|nr:hypothetical protein [Desulfomarina profundi]BCL63262.1 hypothetical protein DGMP_39550 [Desulfomarina profundi]
MDSVSTLFWGVLFGAVGLGFFTYGRKQRAVVPLSSGIALCLIPYFISNSYLLVAAGCVLVIVPFFLKI